MPLDNYWKTRITNANRYYTQWEDRFKCKRLEDYYEGHQWMNAIDLPYYRPYVVNLFYSELKKKLANIIYQNIEFSLTPEEASFAYDPQQAMESAQRKQDLLNSLIKRPEADFDDNLRLTAQDSYFRFSVMEVGYAADWRNPAKKQIITSEHDETDPTFVKAKVIEDEEVPLNERVYFKRVKASRFRVSVSDSPFLRNCSWAGYYSYFYKESLLKTKGITLSKDYESGLSSEYMNAKIYQAKNAASTDSLDMQEALKAGRVCVVWNIWDNERNKRLLIIEPTYEIIWEDTFERLPFSTFRHDLRLDGWYPVPPMYQWLAPQDEVNQAREQMRNYRKRFTRKFGYSKIKPEELEKFKSEFDGELIDFGAQGKIEAIGNPEIGISIVEGLTAGRDDFDIVSGSSKDMNTVRSNRTTATQSRIQAASASVAQSFEQMNFDLFYISVGREALKVAEERFSQGQFIKGSLSDIPFLGEMPRNPVPSQSFITPGQLSDGISVNITFSVLNGSPMKMQEELDKFIKFLTILSQFPQINLSPTLIYEAAYRVGYRNMRVIGEMQRAALLQMMGQAQQMGGGEQLQQMLGGNNPANMMKNAMPASTEAIDTQLMNQ